jgi:hypothetical protein
MSFFSQKNRFYLDAPAVPAGICCGVRNDFHRQIPASGNASPAPDKQLCSYTIGSSTKTRNLKNLGNPSHRDNRRSRTNINIAAQHSLREIVNEGKMTSADQHAPTATGSHIVAVFR